MSGAQSWSVKGIDPKVREAAREAAARQGMSLGEYLSQALQTHQPSGGQPATYASAQPPTPAATRFRTQRFVQQPQFEEEEEDWSPSGSPHHARTTDPARLAQRIESIERRTQLAVTGLDRAVSTIDRSMLGLAARIEDAEALSGESADRIADALEQFRVAGDTLAGRLESAEHAVGESRTTLERARGELAETRDRLTHQVTTTQVDLGSAKARLEAQVEAAEEVARRAEAAANFLSTELENRDAALGHKLGALEDKTRDGIGQALALARNGAEEAARQAAEASADAVLELRALHDRLAERLIESEHNARRAIETAVEDTRTNLGHRIASVESEIGARIASAEQLKAEQQALISRIEKAEGGARESTAGLRQAAGAAIADLRNAQLGLAARLKQVEEAAGRAGALDLAEVRAHQAEIGERLGSLETKVQASPMQEALANFEKRLEEVARNAQQANPALAHVERRLDDLAMRVEQPTASHQKLEEVGGAVKTLDEALSRLTARLAETETSANTAIRTLEETVSSLGARVEKRAAVQETENLRAMLETRLDDMAQSVAHMVGEARTEIAGQVQAALGGDETEGLEGALLDVNRRLAAAERRQAQTIEAISIEIKRMSETVDKRLRTVESRNDDAAGATIREELSHMAQKLEARFDEIERREAAGFDRMGLEVGRLSERLEDRVGAVEGRSAQAIEHVGEQVARMAERFNQRHELLARDLGERMLDSEERAGARVADAIGSIMQRLSEVEEHSTEAVAPVRKAVSSVASRLEALETGKDIHEDDDIPSPSRRYDDYNVYSPQEPLTSGPAMSGRETSEPPAYVPYVSPMDAAQPVRAAPLPPHSPVVHHTPNLVEPDHDIYFAEDVEPEETTMEAAYTPPASPSMPPPLDLSIGDDVIIEDAFLEHADAFAPPPPEDDDPFWAPETTLTPATLQSPAEEAPSIAESAETPPPVGKNDYLNAARKAAQAQTAGTKTRKEARTQDSAEATSSSLRGSSRIVLWGAAGAIALLVAGGAWYLHAQEEARTPVTPPAPETPAPVQQSAAPITDDSTASTDPFAQSTPDASATGADTQTPPTTAAPTQAAAPTTAPPTTAPAAATPLHTTPQAGRTPSTQNALVAAPLSPRSVSLEAAARGGDAVAQYEVALQRIAAGHPNEAVLMLHTAADHGLAMAQYRLAKLYERGEGVPTDLTLARQWTERAAAAGNKRAMHDLGVYFARGEGAPLDEAAAFRWFRQAAELGVADSQFNLGVLYQQGRGVGASPSEAEFWFLVAARQGDEDAAARAQTLAGQLQPIQVDQARARAEAFRPRAASAIANGEFGPRPWASTTPPSAVAAQPAPAPRRARPAA